MSDFRVQGADEFYRLSRALRNAGRTGLRKELTKGLRLAAKPLIAQTRAAAAAELPKRGGLGRSVAKAPQRVTVATGARTVGVRIVAKGPVRGANAGTVRHPVFGHRDRFVFQQVRGGWFDRTLTDAAPTVTPAILAAMDAVMETVVRDG